MVILVLYLLGIAVAFMLLMRNVVRSYRTKPPPEPDTLTAELMATKRHLRRLESRDWYQMWDDALTEEERAEKRILHQRHKNGESTADHRHGLFPGDYIQIELKTNQTQGHHDKH